MGGGVEPTKRSIAWTLSCRRGVDVNELNFKLGTLFIIKTLNGLAGDKSVSLQHGVPNGRKVGSRPCHRSALEHEIIRRIRHRNHHGLITLLSRERLARKIEIRLGTNPHFQTDVLPRSDASSHQSL
jgi:hypothetical protein